MVWLFQNSEEERSDTNNKNTVVIQYQDQCENCEVYPWIDEFGK